MKILLIEDHKDVAYMLQFHLEKNGYAVDVASDGIDGEIKARTGDYDLLIVDWMLPGQAGTDLIKRLRKEEIRVPILMMTARSEQQDQIEALNVGADDFMTKPFSFEVLLARLRALTRRACAPPPDAAAPKHLECGVLQLDLRRHTASIGAVSLDLRVKEYQLLMLLAENPNQVLTRTEMAERIWDNVFVSDDVLNTTISSLRRKLHESMRKLESHPRVEIETLRNIGYRLSVSFQETV